MTAIDDWTVTNAYGDDPVSEAVVRAVAAATDRSVADLRPLYYAVDSDSLDRLLEGAGEPSIRFDYEGCHVTVTETHVRVSATDDAGMSTSR
ncbi:HalOD1 output domain-containing protein [Halosimplex aquaticum]|uniref:HalOD1 output domain-containing protein n=1 Tax=Halosimplex aquaticum TaxID=3026162 RepID=A0ABD5Y537_9EURY|nr:HalOD1 output domain-containing protein [Halosimplex aquaticum]